jgi:hypothetical protein
MANVLNRLKVQIKKTYYIYERYNVDATFALLYHAHPLHVDELADYVRISDDLIPLDEHHYFITFTFTNNADAYKAAQNLIQSLDGHFNDHSCCIVLDTFDTQKSANVVLGRLHQILVQTRKKSYPRIENETVLDGCI